MRHNLTWESFTITRREYKKIFGFLWKIQIYSALNSEQLRVMREFISKERLTINLDQFKNLWHIVMKQKVISRSRIVYSIKNKLLASYKSGGNIVDIARSADLAPIVVARTIMINLGYDQRDIDAILGGAIESSKVFHGRDLLQFNAAFAADAFNNIVVQQFVNKVALEREADLVAYLRGRGIRLRTEDDIRAKNAAATLTPDILFDDEVYINGARVYWIDHKDYFGTDLQFLYTKNIKQADKYNAAFGAGAILFRYGFIEDLRVPGTVLLGGLPRA